MRSRRLALWLAAVLGGPGLALAPAAVALAGTPGAGPAWAELPPAQQTALAPLRTHWSGLDGDRKSKWIAVAQRFPGLPPQEQQRVQARMTQWAAMSPNERGRARQRYQELSSLPAADRQALWEAYSALPAEERQALARRSAPAPSAAASAAHERRSPSAAATGIGARGGAPLAPVAPVAPATPAAPAVPGARTPLPATRAAAQGEVRKRAVPVNPQPPAARPVTPTVVQVKPGVTTTLVNKTPSPPLHNQPGLPKITATPGFVDPQTLLPSRGPQGAAAIRMTPGERPAAAPPAVAPQEPAAPPQAAASAGS
ncbi:MAG: hypothetical protein AMXMBFR78_36610 [Rubrivivax sp.]